MYTIKKIMTIGKYISYAITDPEQGNWTANISAGNLPSEGVKYELLTYLQTSTTLTAYPDKTNYQPNEQVNLTAVLNHADNTTSDIAVTAEITQTNGSKDQVILYDDGAHGDNQTGDGIYGNTYSPANTVGTYQIVTTVTGKVNGERFQRQAIKYFWVKQFADISISSGDIRFSNDNPAENDNITITATLYNNGSVEARDAKILFYDGNPQSGNKIGETTVTIPAGGSVQTSVSWQAVSGEHDIYIGTDPFNTGYEETDYSNNKADKTLQVKS